MTSANETLVHSPSSSEIEAAFQAGERLAYQMLDRFPSSAAPAQFFATPNFGVFLHERKYGDVESEAVRDGYRTAYTRDTTR